MGFTCVVRGDASAVYSAGAMPPFASAKSVHDTSNSSMSWMSGAMDDGRYNGTGGVLASGVFSALSSRVDRSIQFDPLAKLSK